MKDYELRGWGWVALLALLACIAFCSCATPRSLPDKFDLCNMGCLSDPSTMGSAVIQLREQPLPACVCIHKPEAA